MSRTQLTPRFPRPGQVVGIPAILTGAGSMLRNGLRMLLNTRPTAHVLPLSRVEIGSVATAFLVPLFHGPAYMCGSTSLQCYREST